MTSLKGLTIVLFTLCTVVLAAENDSANVNIPPGPGNANTTTITPSTTTPTTTTSKPTTTTSEPTTTASPKTTTTTTPKTTTITTSIPTTTTTSKPTPKPTPPAPVDPEQGKWVANYTDTNRTCMIVQIAVQIEIPYKDGNKSMIYPINVPANASSIGDCNKTVTEQYMKLTWLSKLNESNSVTLNFNKTNSSKFELDSIEVSVTIQIPGANASTVYDLVHKKHEFVTPIKKSYKCAPEQSLNLTRTSDNTTSYLHVSHVHIQAFRNTTSGQFDEAFDCVASETPDVVPIAVGCALAALVIVVLIIYLVGRRRSQARGYLSM